MSFDNIGNPVLLELIKIANKIKVSGFKIDEIRGRDVRDDTGHLKFIPTNPDHRKINIDYFPERRSIVISSGSKEGYELGNKIKKRCEYDLRGIDVKNL